MNLQYLIVVILMKCRIQYAPSDMSMPSKYEMLHNLTIGSAQSEHD